MQRAVRLAGKAVGAEMTGAGNTSGTARLAYAVVVHVETSVADTVVRH